MKKITALLISLVSMIFLLNLNFQCNLLAKPGITYKNSPYTFFQNYAITTIKPTLTGAPSKCISSPDLPAGLKIDATCSISGTPTITQGSTSYSITATNANGPGLETIYIAILPPAPQLIALSCTSSINPVSQYTWSTSDNITCTVTSDIVMGSTGVFLYDSYFGDSSTVYGGTTIHTGSVSGTVIATLTIASPAGNSYQLYPAIYLCDTSLASCNDYMYDYSSPRYHQFMGGNDIGLTTIIIPAF